MNAPRKIPFYTINTGHLDFYDESGCDPHFYQFVLSLFYRFFSKDKPGKTKLFVYADCSFIVYVKAFHYLPDCFIFVIFSDTLDDITQNWVWINRKAFINTYDKLVQEVNKCSEIVLETKVPSPRQFPALYTLIQPEIKNIPPPTVFRLPRIEMTIGYAFINWITMNEYPVTVKI